MPKQRSLQPLPPGQIVDTYEILHLLNSGGQAQIYLARVVRPPQPPIQQVVRHVIEGRANAEFVEAQRLCVMKLALPGSEDNLRDEHQYLLDQRFQHPRLPKLYGANRGETTTERRRGLLGLGYVHHHNLTGERLHLPYITMPYVLGGSLMDLIKLRKFEPFPPATAVRIALQVGEAVQHLHTQMGLVHQDIAPSNVLLQTRLSSFRAQVPECMLIDLAVADSPHHPKLRSPYGRRMYQPPERLKTPPSPIDWSVDVYSLGMLLYELLVGRLPARPSGAEIVVPPPLHEIAPRLSRELTSVVMNALSPQPQHRPSVTQFNQQLASLPEAAATGALRLPLWGAS